MARKLLNIHPGEVLLEEFLVPMGISQNRVARDIGVSPRRINEIVHGKRAVTADTAVRLAKYFGVSEQFWMGLQADCATWWHRSQTRCYPLARGVIV